MTEQHEVELAVTFGVAALGFVSSMPSGPAIIDDELARELVARVPPGVATFLLTSRTTAAGIIEQQRMVRSNTLQIVDRVSAEVYRDLRLALPGIALVQVLHVIDNDVVDEALRIEADVDAILLDSGRKRAGVMQFGGTGTTHDWTISRRLVRAVSRPVFLAGGLNAENIRRAIIEVEPFGVDVCSGVRTAGRLDEEKLASLCRSVRDV